MGRVVPELVSLPGKTIIRDATRRLRFVVNAAGWLHSMVLHGSVDAIPKCSSVNDELILLMRFKNLHRNAV